MSGLEPLPKLSASRSRSEFFRHLGLSESNERDKRLYQMMMEEAAAGRARTCQNADNLTPQSRGSQPPYSASQITETAKHREVQNIYVTSCADTRRVYDRGITYEGTNWDNWIIRWCLWHVFRYRDDRNRNRGTLRNRGTSSQSDSDASNPETWATTTGGTYVYPYDPVRDL